MSARNGTVGASGRVVRTGGAPERHAPAAGIHTVRMSARRGTWERLAAAAPVPPELTAMLIRLDDLGLRDLEARLEDCHDDLRVWASRPENARRVSAEGPRHLERLALGTLLERRLA